MSLTIGTHLRPRLSNFTLEQRTNENSPSQIWTNWSANNYAPAYTQTRIWEIITNPSSQSLNSRVQQRLCVPWCPRLSIEALSPQSHLHQWLQLLCQRTCRTVTL